MRTRQLHPALAILVMTTAACRPDTPTNQPALVDPGTVAQAYLQAMYRDGDAEGAAALATPQLADRIRQSQTDTPPEKPLPVTHIADYTATPMESWLHHQRGSAKVTLRVTGTYKGRRDVVQTVLLSRVDHQWLVDLPEGEGR